MVSTGRNKLKHHRRNFFHCFRYLKKERNYCYWQSVGHFTTFFMSNLVATIENLQKRKKLKHEGHFSFWSTKQTNKKSQYCSNSKRQKTQKIEAEVVQQKSLMGSVTNVSSCTTSCLKIYQFLTEKMRVWRDYVDRKKNISWDSSLNECKQKWGLDMLAVSLKTW